MLLPHLKMLLGLPVPVQASTESNHNKRKASLQFFAIKKWQAATNGAIPKHINERHKPIATDTAALHILHKLLLLNQFKCEHLHSPPLQLCPHKHNQGPVIHAFLIDPTAMCCFSSNKSGCVKSSLFAGQVGSTAEALMVVYIQAVHHACVVVIISRRILWGNCVAPFHGSCI